MRPKDFVLAGLIVAVIIGAGAYLALRSDDKSDSTSVSKQGAATAPAVPPAAPPASAPPVATPAPAAQPSAAAAGASCTGPSLASISRTGARSFPAAPKLIIDPAKTYTAVIKTNRGDITVALAAKDAPITVNNFVFLSCNGYYDGLSWHRVVKTPQPFVIQGGDPKGDGSGGPGYQFKNEVSPNLKHDAPGVLAMANAGPDTNGSQFYITLAAQPALDGKYNVFGKVTDGFPVAASIVVGDKIESISIREN